LFLNIWGHGQWDPPGGFAAAALCALALPQRRLRRTARGAVDAMDAMDAGGVPRRVALGVGMALTLMQNAEGHIF